MLNSELQGQRKISIFTQETRQNLQSKLQTQMDSGVVDISVDDVSTANSIINNASEKLLDVSENLQQVKPDNFKDTLNEIPPIAKETTENDRPPSNH